jgi:hypothetical protein
MYRRRDQVRPVRPPIAALPIWDELRRWIDPQVGSQNQARFPFRTGMPPDLRVRALEVTVACHCGVAFHPVRGSHHGTLALYVTGRRDGDHRVCSYGDQAKARVRWLQEDLGKVERAAPEPSDGPGLFS